MTESQESKLHPLLNMSEPFIQHSHIAAFAEAKVNLKRDHVAEFRDQVNRLRDQLTTYIAEHPDYNLVKMLHSGSVMKGTALKTLNDMDVAVYVKPSDETEDESRLLNWLADRLREVYSTLQHDQIQARDHCVSVSFYGSGLDVDVAPVIYEGDPDDRGYLVARDTGERVLTSIPLHLDFLRARKKAQPDHFAQVVRLLKWWARERKVADSSFRFKSFMIELICAHLADDDLDMSNYPDALERVFAYIVRSGLRDRIWFDDYYAEGALAGEAHSVMTIFDPVNPANNVAAQYGENDCGRIIEAATDALDALTEARFATTQGRAIDMWKIVFGSSFQLIES